MRKWWIRLLLLTVVTVVLAIAVGVTIYFKQPLLEMHHLPKVYPRRANTLTANVTGAVSRFARKAEFRLNEGDWRPLAQHGQRTPKTRLRSGFLIEMWEVDLRPGKNRLDLRVEALLRSTVEKTFEFEYDTTPVSLPLTKTWENADLEAQDGRWDTIEVDGEWRVRPAPGYEGYDRLLTVTGAFAGPRRVETYVVFRDRAAWKPFGFGVLPLWAGHPDADREWTGPRRGWRFSLVWYYSYYQGVGAEFSDKVGSSLYEWVSTYRDLYNIERNVKYKIVVECWTEKDAAGNHFRWVQRFKWFKEGTPEPAQWTEIADTLTHPLPDIEYAVVLNAHRSKVEFGPVTVLPLARD